MTKKMSYIELECTDFTSEIQSIKDQESFIATLLRR